MTHRLTPWRKSTFSDANAHCVEVSTSPSIVLVRDSKHPDNGHVVYATAEVAALVDAAAEGRLDHLA